MYGNVYFSHIDEDSDDGIVCVYKHKLSKGCTRCIYSQDRDIVAFYSNGTTGNLDFNVTNDCMLYPSKDQRDWSKWKCSKPKFDPKTLNPFDKVLARIDDGDAYCWFADFVSVPALEGDTTVCVIGDRDVPMVIPYNDDTKHLVGTSDEAPEFYRYWEE